jgi:hypothetical protein
MTTTGHDPAPAKCRRARIDDARENVIHDTFLRLAGPIAVRTRDRTTFGRPVRHLADWLRLALLSFINADRSLLLVGAHCTKGRSSMRAFSDDKSDSEVGKPSAGGSEARIEEAVLQLNMARIWPWYRAMTSGDRPLSSYRSSRLRPLTRSAGRVPMVGRLWESEVISHGHGGLG